MSRIFIDRPIFAWVIAIIIMLAGVGAIMALPIAQYPDVAPPQVNVRATYPGASAETVQNSVTQIIEQQLSGIDGLIYFSSSSTSRGQVNITATFEKGTDPDIAQVQVQNQVQQALSRLPQQVQQQGLRVTKSNPDFLMIVGVYDETDKRTNQDVSDWMASNMQDTLARTPGVGDTNVFGAPYAMRIWLRSAGELFADAERCDHGDPEPEYRSRRGRDRRPAAAEHPDAQRDRDRPVAAPDSGAVRKDHPQDRD
jgi:multidrug efflux pump